MATIMPPTTTPSTTGAAARRGAHAGPAARVRNLTKTYGSGQAKVVALDDVTLDLHRGEFTAEAKGAPVEVKGTTHIKPNDPKTVYTIAAEVNVKVPLIGGKISNWAAGTTKEQIQMEFDAGDRWLADHR